MKFWLDARLMRRATVVAGKIRNIAYILTSEGADRRIPVEPNESNEASNCER